MDPNIQMFREDQGYHIDWKIVPFIGTPDVDECSVCMGDEIDITTPCDHKFHWHCLKEWLNTKSTCPICRFDFRTFPTGSSLEKIKRGLKFYDLSGFPILYICQCRKFEEGIALLEQMGHGDGCSPYDCCFVNFHLEVELPIANYIEHSIAITHAFLKALWLDFLSNNGMIVLFWLVQKFINQEYIELFVFFILYSRAEISSSIRNRYD